MTELHTTEFHAEVLDIREESRIGGFQQWQMLLTRTGFSEAAPIGVLRVVARSGAALEVSVSGIVVNGEDVWHRVDKPLGIGTPVTGHVAAPVSATVERTG